jgi:hypothetical protein
MPFGLGLDLVELAPEVRKVEELETTRLSAA